MTTTNSNKSDQVTVLIDELDQCREEDRDARNQMLQAVAVCMAALAVVFAISSNMFENLRQDAGAISDPVMVVFCELVTVAIIIASFSYLLSLGMVAPLRYYRMRDLERKIREVAGFSDDVGWIEFRTAHTSLNPKHLYSEAAAMHYASLLMAIASVIVACMCFFLIFWELSLQFTIILLFFVAVPYIAFVLAVYFWSTSHAEEWYRQTPEIVEGKRSPGGPASAVRPNVKRFVRYLVYPRPQDVLKNGFLLLGCLIGIAVGNDAVFPDAYIRSLPTIFFVWFVFDALGYQARYQWNDIRGAQEDSKNPQRELRERLRAVCGDIGLAKRMSAAVLVYKMLLASALLIFRGDRVAVVLFVGLVATWVVASLYETARRRRWNFGVIFNLVCLGYPLRLLVGLAAFAPSFSDLVGALSVVPIVCIACATFSYGKVFVGVTWALEGADFRRGDSRTDRPPRNLSEYHKPHVVRLASELDGKRDSSTGVDDVIMCEHPLAFRCPVLTHWNVWMLVTILLLSAGVTVAAWDAGWPVPVALAIGAAYVAWFGAVLLFPSHWVFWLVVGAVVTVVPIVLSMGWAQPWIGFGQSHSSVLLVILAVACFGYMLIYLMFRNTSYGEMAAMPVMVALRFFWIVANVKGALIDERVPCFEDYARQKIERRAW